MRRSLVEMGPFYYGVRRKVSADVHGQPIYDETPLQPTDFLNPTADDNFEVGPSHDQDVARLLRIFQVHYRHNQLAGVFANAKIRWDNGELDQPRPDIIIVHGGLGDGPLRLHESTFDMRDWEVPPRCIIEVTSPRFAEFDLSSKVDLYARGGVEEYFIIDSGLREDNDIISYSVHGYQLDGTTYRPIQSDAQGMVLSEVNHVTIGPTANRAGFVVVDMRTEQPIQAEDIVEKERIAEVQGSSRASDIGSALDFLRGDVDL